MIIITIAGYNNGAITKLSPASTEGNPSPPINSFINYNLQRVNNSTLVINTSLPRHDPVHVFFPGGGGGGGLGLHLKDCGDGQNN